MMKAVYFPFTHVSEVDADGLIACFRDTTIYQLSTTRIQENLAERPYLNRFDMRVPIGMDEPMLRRILEDYRIWTETHHKSLLDYLKQTDQVPFFDEQSTSRIAAEIKTAGSTAGDAKEAAAAEERNSLLQSGLFLHAAETYDRTIEEKRGNLLRFDKMAQGFLSDIRETDDLLYQETAAGHMTAREDPGQYMAEERIRSWFSIAAYDRFHYPVYVTTSPAVIDYLLDELPEMSAVISSVPVPAVGDAVPWVDRLDGICESLINDPAGSPPFTARFPDDAAAGNRHLPLDLSLYILPSMSAGGLVRQFSRGIPDIRADSARRTGPVIIGLVCFSSKYKNA